MKPSQQIHFYKSLPDWKATLDANSIEESSDRLEPSTCVEAEPFALRVLDSSMEPEFRKGCIIVIDPTGRATQGSYVLARTVKPTDTDTPLDEAELDDLIFRQLTKGASGDWKLQALNDESEADDISCELSDIVGVIVQRAGVRRRYHKKYDIQ